MSKPPTRLRNARRKSEAAERASAAARLNMIEAVEDAARLGMPKTKIAELAGISRQTVYDILGD